VERFPRSRGQSEELREREWAGAGVSGPVMIDQGFCFNAGEWNFPDCARSARIVRAQRVYEGVTGMDSFAGRPGCERMDKAPLPEKVLAELAEEYFRRRGMTYDYDAGAASAGTAAAEKSRGWRS